MARLVWRDIERLSSWLQVDPCAVSAVVQVEANGNGFLPDGRPKILFEGHVFWQQLEKIKHRPLDYLTLRRYLEKFGNVSDILYQKQTNEFYVGGAGEWDRMARAHRIHNEAALMATSWGIFQIMGFNYAVCGFSTIHTFVGAMRDGYPGQLEAFGGFLIANNLIKPLQQKDWTTFARGYNGKGHAKGLPEGHPDRYDSRMAAAYNQCVVDTPDTPYVQLPIEMRPS